MTNNHWE